MIERIVTWAWIAWRPREGWLAVALLGGATGAVAMAILEAAWVREDEVILPSLVLGLALGSLLAKRPLSAWASWLLLFGYGLLVPIIYLGNLLPPIAAWLRVASLYQYWRTAGGLLVDRFVGWGTAVFSGGRSEETILFALLLGVLTWLLAAFLGWSAFRHQKPLTALTLLGVGLGVNGYFSGGNGGWMALFIALTAGLTAVFHFATLEREWETRQTDYSTEIKIELTIFAIGIAAGLVALSLALPAVRLSTIVEAFNRLTAVSAAEASAERAFAGVRQPLTEQGNGVGVGEAGSGVSILPSAFLLGNAPELSETVVMTATLHDLAGEPVRLRGLHWRGASYDVYTGRGWQRSEERLEELEADALLAQPPAESTFALRQEVVWQFDDRSLRYSVGLPTEIDQAGVAAWRGQVDFVRLVGEGTRYQLSSRISQATAAELQTAVLTEVPPALLARYTALPEDVPDRVLELADEIAGELPTPYDQARAIEQFLRQYPYSLDVPLPPRDVDPVDFFLFDLQQGYCDYYATAMVVLARSLGLPARMGTGFLAQPPDAFGVQTVRQINAHSWAEIYFAGYGWVEFEPTAAFDQQAAAPETSDLREPIYEPAYPDGEPLPPPIPTVEERPFPFWLLAVVGACLLAVAVGWRLWRRPEKKRGIVADFGWLQQRAAKIGAPMNDGQTPDEFVDALLANLKEHNPRLLRHHWHRLVEKIEPSTRRLVAYFHVVRYGNQDEPLNDDLMRKIRPLWRRLRLFSWLPNQPHHENQAD